jgi:hypothetical protein
LFAEPNGLGAASSAQLVEGPAAVSLDGILTDEETICDLAVAETLSDEAEDFELTRRNAEGVKLGLVEGEGGWRIGGDEDFAKDDFFAGFGELDAEPDAEGDEDDGDNSAIDLEGVLDDEELVLRPAKDGDEYAANEAENKDVAKDVALHVCWVDSTSVAKVRANAASGAEAFLRAKTRRLPYPKRQIQQAHALHQYPYAKTVVR